MWAAAVVDLGLPQAEFWELTMDEFAALMDRRRANEAAMQTAENARAGTIAAVIYNVHRGPRQKAASWRDFFPPPQMYRRQLTPEEQIRRWDAWVKFVEERHGQPR